MRTKSVTRAFSFSSLASPISALSSFLHYLHSWLTHLDGAHSSRRSYRPRRSSRTASYRAKRARSAAPRRTCRTRTAYNRQRRVARLRCRLHVPCAHHTHTAGCLLREAYPRRIASYVITSRAKLTHLHCVPVPLECPAHVHGP